MANAEAVRKTWALLTANKDRWLQRNFSDRNECGTTACFAGFAVLAHGATLDSDLVFRNADGSWCDAELDAAELLEFDEVQQDEIFYAVDVKNVNEMRQIVEQFTGVDLSDVKPAGAFPETNMGVSA